MKSEDTAALKPHELDDGASEVVQDRPRRRIPKATPAGQAALSPVGGKLTVARAQNEAVGGEYIAFRKPSGAGKVLLKHLETLAVLWRLWAGKRASGEEPGVSVKELAEEAKKDLSVIRAVLDTLAGGNLIRSVRTSTGWGTNRVAYLPTDLGVQLLATAETFGPGTSIQVGGSPTAWQDRSATAPESFFRHAALLSGQKGN